MELGYFDKHFIKNTRPHSKTFSSFFPRYSEDYILKGKFNEQVVITKAFFPKLGHFFRFSKKGRGGHPLPPSFVNVSVAEYASISLNILENASINCSMPGLWICLIILHVRQAFEDASGSKYARILNMAHLYMQELHIVLNMSECGSISFNNAWRCLNMF